MKKVFCFFSLCLILCFCALPVFSAETDDFDNIKNAVIEYEQTTDFTEEDVTIYYNGTFSDGRIVFTYEVSGRNYTANIKNVVIGSYQYQYTYHDIYLYDGERIYRLQDAYETGVVSDAVLDEIATLLDFSLIETTEEATEENPAAQPGANTGLKSPETGYHISLMILSMAFAVLIGTVAVGKIREK